MSAFSRISWFEIAAKRGEHAILRRVDRMTDTERLLQEAEGNRYRAAIFGGVAPRAILTSSDPAPYPPVGRPRSRWGDAPVSSTPSISGYDNR